MSEPGENIHGCTPEAGFTIARMGRSPLTRESSAVMAHARTLTLTPDDALVIVDVQNDFLPGGALAVGSGDRVIGPLNRLMPAFAHVYATRDWHPHDHGSFAHQGGPWPVHCVQETRGAALSKDLTHAHIDEIVSKGTDRTTEGYSAFDGTGFEERLRAAGVKRLIIGGLATDYCVRATALDAAQRGFDVVVLTDAVAAVNVDPADEDRALREMSAAGCRLAESGSLTTGAKRS